MKPKAPFQKDLSSAAEIPKRKSITKINAVKITVETTTIIVLLCNSFQVGQETLCTISVIVSLK